MTYDLSGLGDAASVTVVSGSSLARVYAAFGVDPKTSELITEDDVYGGTDGFEAAVCASQVDSQVIVVELNGYRGSLISTLRDARTEGSRCGNVFWNHDDDLPEATFIDSDGSVHNIELRRSIDLTSLPPALRFLGSELIAQVQEFNALDLDNVQGRDIVGYDNGFVDTLGRMLETFIGLEFLADLPEIAETGLRRDWGTHP
jgi:hypothetical protein